jgi:hypothetical protein
VAAERPRWRHPKILFLVFLSLASLAFVSLRRLGGTTHSVLEDAYHSIGIFTANGSWAFDPNNHVNALFKFLATVTPVVTFIGFVELLTGGVIPALVRQRSLLRLRLGVTGCIVCGLTPQGLIFARAVARSGTLVFILDDAPEEALADVSARDRIPVLPVRILDRPRLAHRLFQQCDLFSFLPSTDRQVDFVAHLDARLRGPTDRSFWFLLQERGLAQRLDGYLRFTASASTLRPRFFDIDALVARQVLGRHPLDVLADAADHRQIHMAVVGFGSLGRAIVKEAARLVVTLPSLDGVLLRVTIIDRDAGHAAAALEAEDPQIRQLLELATVTLTLQPAGMTAAQLELLPDHVTAWFVTVGDPELAFATSVSLRNWLLEPPLSLGETWRQAHACVPIMIRIRDWEGLGRLIRSNVDWPEEGARSPELPDGIFGFGCEADILDPAFIMSAARETGARVLHQSYRLAGAEARQLSGRPEDVRAAERDWRELASDLRDLNLYGFDHIALKARAIGHRVVQSAPAKTRQSAATRTLPGTPAQAYPSIPAGVMPAMKLLSRLEHQRYVAERVACGWRQASTRCDQLRLHPALVDWSALPASEQVLDEKHVQSMFHALAASGQRMLPSLCIAVAGSAEPLSSEANGQMEAALIALVQANAQTAPVLLTTAAPGAGLAAAEAARRVGIPWIAVLPLPFELYREDFTPADRHRLQALIAFAERYVELPLRFGRASDLTRGHAENRERRRRQYVFASAFMVERAQALLTIGDSEAVALSRAWWSGEQPIDPAYRTRCAFMPPPASRLPLIEVEGRMFFFEKKNQKTFTSLG